MKTKEMTFTLPVMIALYELFFMKGKAGRRILFLIPLLITMIIIPMNLITLDKPVGEIIGDVSKKTVVQTGMTRFDYLYTQFKVITRYIRLLFFPAGQNMDYDYPVSSSLFAPGVFSSFLFLAGIFFSGVFLYLRSRTADSSLKITAFGIFWFFIALSVESSIIPITDVIFEHRVYLPSVGFFAAFVTGVFILSRTFKSRTVCIPAVVISLVFVIPFSVAAYARNSIWGNEMKLWEDVVEKSPDKPRGHYNLATIYGRKGMKDKAVEHFRISIKHNYETSISHNNLGIVYYLEGEIDRAISHYESSIEADSGNIQAHYNIGLAYRKKGMNEKAGKHFSIHERLKRKALGEQNE